MSQHWLKKFLLLGIATMLIIVGITSFTATQATATFVYRVTQLVNNGEQKSIASDINDSGQVAGSSLFGTR